MWPGSEARLKCRPSFSTGGRRERSRPKPVEHSRASGSSRQEGGDPPGAGLWLGKGQGVRGQQGPAGSQTPGLQGLAGAPGFTPHQALAEMPAPGSIAERADSLSELIRHSPSGARRRVVGGGRPGHSPASKDKAVNFAYFEMICQDRSGTEHFLVRTLVRSKGEVQKSVLGWKVNSGSAKDSQA